MGTQGWFRLSQFPRALLTFSREAKYLKICSTVSASRNCAVPRANGTPSPPKCEALARRCPFPFLPLQALDSRRRCAIPRTLHGNNYLLGQPATLTREASWWMDGWLFHLLCSESLIIDSSFIFLQRFTEKLKSQLAYVAPIIFTLRFLKDIFCAYEIQESETHWSPGQIKNFKPCM